MATKTQAIKSIKSALESALESVQENMAKGDLTRVWIGGEKIQTLGRMGEFIEEGASAIECWKYFCGLETGLRDEIPHEVQAWGAAAYAADEGVSVESLFTPNGWKSIAPLL